MRSKPRNEPSRSARSDEPFPSLTVSKAKSVDAVSGTLRRSCVPGLSTSRATPIAAGDRFGRLTVVERAPARAGDGAVMWSCRCDCGRDTKASAGNLRSGNTRSCGCLRRKGARDLARTMSGGRRPEYAIWNALVQRCTNPRNKRFADYGGRGMTVCDAWRASFDAFYADVGPRPSRDLSIDRIENDRGYEPGNVRWATRSEQRANRRDSIKVGAA